MRALLSVLGAAVLVALGAWLLTLRPAPSPAAVPGLTQIATAGFCPKPQALCQEADYTPVTLPHRPDRQSQILGQAATYRFEVNEDVLSDRLPGILVPHFSDNILVWVNGQAVSPDRRRVEPFHHHWNRPLFTSFGRQLVDRPITQIEIELNALPSGYLSLSPIYLGPSQTLEFEAQKVHVQRLGQVRTFTAVAIFSFFPIFATWLTRRDDEALGAIVGALLSGIVVGLHLAFPNATLVVAFWPVIWNTALLLFVFSIFRYARRQLGLGPSVIEKITLGLVGLGTAALILLPTGWMFYTSMGVHSLSLLMGLATLACFLHQFRDGPVSNGLHLLILGSAAAVGWHDYLFYFVSQTDIAVPRSGTGFFLVIFGIFASLFNRLAVTLSGYETLTQTMRGTIEERTRQLMQTQAKVVAFERTQAIDAERERIMFELHDGVGGQLVNLMAYVEQSPKPDPTLRHSLETTIQDMALIFDSLDGLDDVLSLFAALRERLEIAAQTKGVALKWEVDDLSSWAIGASQALNAVRIVQEAATNALRHSDCTRLCVTVTEASLGIKDNGKGFDMDEAIAKGESGKHRGLRSMKSRAKQIGAALSIESSTAGSVVTISFG